MRPSKLLINLTNLADNYCKIKQHTSSGRVMAVLKANAYGHGLVACAKELEQAGADYFGVALLEEGLELRKAGIRTPVHVFGGILGEQIQDFICNDLELTASSVSKLQQIDQTALNTGIRARVHLKIDTGMGRIGVRPESAAVLIDSCKHLRNTEVKGIFSHFACSDEASPDFSRKQLSLFMPVVQYAKNHLGQNIIAHISNSAGILNFPEANLDMQRAGLILYGVYPDSSFKNTLNLQPVLSLKSQVVYFKVVKQGESVSYGRSWQAQEDSRVLTVPVGYGDGYLRSLSNKATVIVRGQHYPVAGRICMDQFMVNIGKATAYNQDEVTLIGTDGNASIRVEELAELAETVPHEVLSNLNIRLPRQFIW